MPDPERKLSHVDAEGKATMVDVSAKDATVREATATAFVAMNPETVATVRGGGLKKGDETAVLGVARVAGIMAAKKTSELIPLCHPLALTGIRVDLTLEDQGVRIVTEVKTADRTGVEMEALTAAAVAALTIYDMCKSADRSMTIGDIALWEKTGGRSGVYRREPDSGLDRSIDSVLLDHARSADGDQPGDGSSGMIGPAGLGDPAEV
jgi:cyclic pyranopterin monophosphate synthase